jgi:WD40 repeat protein
VPRIWNARTGQLRNNAYAGDQNTHSFLIYSPDGLVLATGSHWDGRHPTRRANWAVLWDPATGDPRHTLVHPNQLYDAEFSQDGRWFATACHDGKARVWEIATGNIRHTFSHNGHVNWVAFSSDGQSLVTSGSGDDHITVWDTVSGKVQRRFPGIPGAQGGAFSGDGRYLAYKAKHGIGVADFTTADIRWHLDWSALGEKGRFLTFSADGRWLVICAATKVSGGKTVSVLDVAAGQIHKALVHENGIEAIAFSPNGQWLAAGTYGTELFSGLHQQAKRPALQFLFQVITLKLSTSGYRFVARPYVRTCTAMPCPAGRSILVADDRSAGGVRDRTGPQTHSVRAGSAADR